MVDFQWYLAAWFGLGLILTGFIAWLFKARRFHTIAAAAGAGFFIALIVTVPVVGVLSNKFPTMFMGGIEASEVSETSEGVIIADLPLSVYNKKDTSSAATGLIGLFEIDVLNAKYDGDIYALVDDYMNDALPADVKKVAANLSSGTALFKNIKGSKEGVIYYGLYLSNFKAQGYPIAYFKVIVYDKISPSTMKFYGFKVEILWPEFYKGQGITSNILLYQMTGWKGMGEDWSEYTKFNWTDLGDNKKLMMTVTPDDPYNCTVPTHIYLKVPSGVTLRDVRFKGESLKPKAVSQLDPDDPLITNLPTDYTHVCLKPLPELYYASTTDRPYYTITLIFNTPSSGTSTMYVKFIGYAKSEKAAWNAGTITIYITDNSNAESGWWNMVIEPIEVSAIMD